MSGSSGHPRRQNVNSQATENDRLRQRLEQTGESKYFDSNRAGEMLGNLQRREAQVQCP